MEKNHRYFIKVPNNKEGRKTIKLIRKYYNNDTYNIRVKGSTIDKSKMPNKNERNYRNDIGAIPLKSAKFLRIYFDKKI